MLINNALQQITRADVRLDRARIYETVMCVMYMDYEITKDNV